MLPSHNCIIIDSMFSFQGTSLNFRRNSMKLLVSKELQSISLVEISGIEPLTSCLQGRRSPSWAKPPYRRNQICVCRIYFSLKKMLARIFVSPFPFKPASLGFEWSLWFEVVGQNGLEPSTSRLSVVCSSQLSYWPISASTFFKSTFLMYPLNWITHWFTFEPLYWP